MKNSMMDVLAGDDNRSSPDQPMDLVIPWSTAGVHQPLFFCPAWFSVSLPKPIQGETKVPPDDQCHMGLRVKRKLFQKCIEIPTIFRINLF